MQDRIALCARQNLFALLACVVLASLGCGQKDSQVTESEEAVVVGGKDMAVLSVRDGTGYLPGEASPYTGWLNKPHPMGSSMMFRLELKQGRPSALQAFHEDGNRCAVAGFDLGTDGLDRIVDALQSAKAPYDPWAVISGYFDGEINAWHPNGHKGSQGRYDKGREEGTWTAWHENGKKFREGTYAGGKMEGNWTDWWDNGQIGAQGRFAGGKKDGLWVLWHKNATKAAEQTYEAGKLVSEKKWDEAGSSID